MQMLFQQAPKANRALARRETISSYLFILPFLLFFGLFMIVPMVMCVFTSFFNYTMSDFTFIGFQNYSELFLDPVFIKSLYNTLLIVLVSVPVVLVFSLWVGSVLCNSGRFSQAFFRCVFYLPVVTGTVAVTVVWKWMFNQYIGLLNYAFKLLGVITQNVSWLGNPATAIWCIITILLTTSIGQPIVLYISALCNVDQSITEAAHVDGATNFQCFWRIKWPAIMPTTVYIVVITTINSFQCFALIQLLTSGGPMNSTSTIMYYIYYNAFKLFRYGYGNAMGVILAIMIAALSAIQFRMFKTER